MRGGSRKRKGYIEEERNEIWVVEVCDITKLVSMHAYCRVGTKKKNSQGKNSQGGRGKANQTRV